MLEALVHRTALLVIDVQQAFAERDAAGASRNNPGAELNIQALLGGFRLAGAAIFHIRHASRQEDSGFRRERPGFAVQPFAAERPGEAVIVKEVNSAFIGTDLEARLRGRGLDHLVICGATSNHCVETTTRMAGNLGFAPFLVRDACWAYDRQGIDGEIYRAEDVHRMTLANLAGEFADITTTEQVLRAIASEAPLKHIA